MSTNEPMLDATSKLSNPKDAIGSDKIPMHLWPASATVGGALGLLEGMLKYGRSNWRAVGVKATIYTDALERHTKKLLEGEDFDEDSGLPHEFHILACAAIMVDAKAAGKFIDDRLYPGGFPEFLKAMTPHVKRLKEKHKDKHPHHYTIADAQTSPQVPLVDVRFIDNPDPNPEDLEDYFLRMVAALPPAPETDETPDYLNDERSTPGAPAPDMTDFLRAVAAAEDTKCTE